MFGHQKQLLLSQSKKIQNNPWAEEHKWGSTLRKMRRNSSTKEGSKTWSRNTQSSLISLSTSKRKKKSRLMPLSTNNKKIQTKMILKSLKNPNKKSHKRSKGLNLNGNKQTLIKLFGWEMRMICMKKTMLTSLRAFLGSQTLPWTGFTLIPKEKLSSLPFYSFPTELHMISTVNTIPGRTILSSMLEESWSLKSIAIWFQNISALSKVSLTPKIFRSMSIDKLCNKQKPSKLLTRK